MFGSLIATTPIDPEWLHPNIFYEGVGQYSRGNATDRGKGYIGPFVSG
jgi:hypothetical protein